MTLITADQRVAQTDYIKGAVIGAPGVGKTSLVYSLSNHGFTPLFIDAESGTLAIKDWQGAVYRVNNWQDCIDLALFLAGPDPTDQYGDYSQAAYGLAMQKPSIQELQAAGINFDVIMIDTLSKIGQWVERKYKQDDAAEGGKTNGFVIYGNIGNALAHWLERMQRAKSCHVWLVAHQKSLGIDQITGKHEFKLELPGSKGQEVLHQLVDEMLTMRDGWSDVDGASRRVFFTRTASDDFNHPYPYCKDRSGQLASIEVADLGAVTRKILDGAKPPQTRIDFSPTTFT
jgi:hypothetical protein